MSDCTVRSITPVDTIDAEIQVPPSKSYTNRALIAAALADGPSTLLNASQSDDSEYLIQGLQQFGVQIIRRNNCLEVMGSSGNLQLPSSEIFLGNAGTALRFLTSFSGLAPGKTILTGDEQMQRRPIQDLLEALHAAGIKNSSYNGFPPVTIYGGNFNGGYIDIQGNVSSQFVSSLLLTAPYAKHPVTIRVRGKLSSLPYIDMSLHIIRTFGAIVDSLNSSVFTVGNRDRYIGQTYCIEGDASSATYFLAAAAMMRGRVVISNLSDESFQGDLQFLKILSDMGCSVIHHEDAIEMRGGQLFGVEVDMNEIPDCVPTLAVLAMFAKGQTTINNVSQLRFKETDRLTVLAKEMTKIGAGVELFEDGMTIHPQPLHGATIATYNDHRIAMSFSVAGLCIPGINIENPMCVSKSFPNFWDEFTKLERKK